VNKAMPIILIALCALALGLPAQSLTITAPNGGETLTLGQTVQITWTANNVNQKVKLQLIRGGGALVGLIQGNLNATPSSFTWTIGQTDSGNATADTNYKIRIRTADNALEDASNGTFTIAAATTPPPPPPPVTINLTRPNDGEEMLIGATFHVTWTSANLNGNNHLELWSGNSKLGIIAQNLPAGPYDYSWKIGYYMGGKAIPGGGYKIKVVNSNGPEDASDIPFTLLPGLERSDPTLRNPAQRYQPELQKKPLLVNVQVLPYAVINSFTINGMVEVGNQRVECFRQQGLRFQANASSFAQPISYRYTLRLLRPSNGMSFVIKQSPWLAQNDFTMQVTLKDIYDILFPEGNSNVPLSIQGSVMVEVKNATQTESPQNKGIQIKLTL
jgi:hypothetical protein